MNLVAPLLRLLRPAGRLSLWASLLLAALLASLLLAGCGGGGATVVVSPTPKPGDTVVQPGWTVRRAVGVQTKKKWTFLVFMNGANDLEEFGILNMNQMEEIGSSDEVNLVVQFKRISKRTNTSDGLDYDRTNGDWDDTRRFFVTRDADPLTINSLLLSQRDGVDMGSKETMQELIQWATATFPAEHYCLVVWNHGAGWRSVKTRAAASPLHRGVSYDDASGNHIDTIDLPAAIDLGNGRKWDVLAFDSSLMQMLEVAYEVRDRALFIAGSEESPDGRGYPYDTFLSHLVGNPDMTGQTLAVQIAEAMLANYGQSSNVTQSVLDASKIAPIVPALDQFGAALTAVKGTLGTSIADAREATESYDYPENRDLLEFVRQLIETPPGASAPRVADPTVVAAAQTLRARVKEAVIKNVNGQAHPRSQGVAVFLPSPFQYRQIDISQANGFGQRYTELSLAQAAPNWQGFLADGPR